MVNWEYRAGILWSYLVELASKKELLTYTELAELVRRASRIPFTKRNIHKALSPIQDFCLTERHPILTAIIVRKGKGTPGKERGVPGDGFAWKKVSSWKEERDKVWEFNWNEISNPFNGFGENDTTESFVEKIIKTPKIANEVYAQVKVRGVLQTIFRECLLSAYKGQCAMCGLGFNEALEAAHIIPWAKCGKSLRVSPNNGILLCANHHKLFDKGRILVTEKYQLKYVENDLSNYSDADKQMLVNLDGKKLQLPENKDLQPDPELLKEFYIQSKHSHSKHN